MVLQKAVDSLKEKPKDDRKAVAGGIAITIVVLLLVGWGLLFFKKIQRGADLRLGGGAQDEFLGSSVREAQDRLMEGFSSFDELRSARERPIEGYEAVQQEDFQESDRDAFGQPTLSD